MRKMMKVVNIHEAKTHFSKLVDSVLRGNEVVIAMAGKPVAKLGPIKDTRPRRFGLLKKKIKIGKDFDAPLPDQILEDFES